RLRVECDACALPFPDACFDGILAINMLHHVIEPARATAEFARVLAPDGLLVAVDPRRGAAGELAKRLLRGRDPADAGPHKAFAEREYASLLRAGGRLRLESLASVGLATLVVGGGLDQLRLSPHLPATALLAGLARLDQRLQKLPGLAGAGLNWVARARA